MKKNISYSLNLISENNLNIFHNPLLFDTNKLITEKDNCLESSFPIENDPSDYNPDLNVINRDNLNLLNQNLNKLAKQTKSIINYKFYINNVIPLLLYENDIIKIINDKMKISYKIKNILDSDYIIRNDPRIEIVKRDITEKLNTRSKRFNKGCKNKKDIKYGRKKRKIYQLDFIINIAPTILLLK